ncbi:hypothetical protein P43SY_008554 [Pythium insidiosum]|uniref:Reverse transcriptase Ty1/copia-type domain-containing protein n=1 Tax=Pythium insidiosum TaxID=114742 RepID=A0AAD5LDN5_PYTIN|nr:hypothetical protein P43SY_008554 [Pythium insidiosum]
MGLHPKGQEGIFIGYDEEKKSCHYDETYSAVIKFGSVFFVFALARICGLKVVVADVPNAYVKGTIKEKIYLKPPRELNVPDGKVLLLLKPLYGLKHFDPCLYVLHGDDGYMLLGLYVDGIPMAGSTPSILERVAKASLNRFQIKAGTATKFLGMNIVDNDRDFYFSQPHMVDEIFKQFIAGAQAVSECGWIRQLIEDIFDVNIPPTLKIDNKSATQSIKNKVDDGFCHLNML